METALYGAGGFFTRAGSNPADHFRTSVHTGSLFAAAVLRVLISVDEALRRPARLDLVDVGAGRGELIDALLDMADADLAGRLRVIAVERAPRPDPTGAIEWRSALPAHVNGLLIATEWLDNVPLNIADGARYLRVDDDGNESPGRALSPADAAWVRRWWPQGDRVEIGEPRDIAWADAVGRLSRGLALAIDYGHLSHARPPLGTLTGYRGGREVRPVPDGDCDLTAHVAMDAVAAAGSAVAGLPARLVRQADALRDLGVSARRPPIAQAHTDPVGYVRALAAASIAAELTEPSGMGGHFWLFQPVGIEALQ